MTPYTPVTALIALSDLAADYKAGVIPVEKMRELLRTIIEGMDVENKDELLRHVLRSWEA